jgi:hypothetical protein
MWGASTTSGGIGAIRSAQQFLHPGPIFVQPVRGFEVDSVHSIGDLAIRSPS